MHELPKNNRLLPSIYTLGWNTHRWSGWPGAFCLDCFIDDPLEQAIADDPYDTWMYHIPACPFCCYNQVEITNDA